MKEFAVFYVFIRHFVRRHIFYKGFPKKAFKFFKLISSLIAVLFIGLNLLITLLFAVVFGIPALIENILEKIGFETSKPVTNLITRLTDMIMPLDA